MLVTATLAVADPPINLVQPRLDQNQSAQPVVFGKDVARALRAHDRTFRVLTNKQFAEHIPGYFQNSSVEAPMAVVKDFNSDGIDDIVVMGISQGNQVRVYSFISNKAANKFDVTQVENWPRDRINASQWRQMGKDEYQLRNWLIYLSLAEPNERRTHGVPTNGEAIKLESDSASFGIFGLRGNTFQRLTPLINRVESGNNSIQQTGP